MIWVTRMLQWFAKNIVREHTLAPPNQQEYEDETRRLEKLWRDIEEIKDTYVRDRARKERRS